MHGWPQSCHEYLEHIPAMATLLIIEFYLSKFNKTSYFIIYWDHMMEIV